MIDLFCFPFAGGNRFSYKEFSWNAPPEINIVILEYPGRDGRQGSKLFSNIDDLVDNLYFQIVDKLSQNYYAFFGHSMGGLIAYLLTRKIIENNLKGPLHLFISGTEGPASISRARDKKHLLNREEFKLELKKYNGMSDLVLANDELFEYLEPIIRADFAAVENYEHKIFPPLNVGITVMYGNEDDIAIEEINLWGNESIRAVNFIAMDGDHFFIFRHVRQILKEISNILHRPANI